MTEDDFKRAAVEATQTIPITDFVALDSIERTYFDKPYYVTPQKKAEKGYVLLREILARTGKAAIALVVIHSRQYLSALIPMGNALVLNILRYYQELRRPEEFNFPAGSLEEYKITEKELEIARMLVDNMAGDWDPSQYRDEYSDALMEWIEKKAQAGGAVPAEAAAEPGKPGKVIDMMDLLKQSVQQASRERGRKPRAGERAQLSRKQASRSHAAA